MARIDFCIYLAVDVFIEQDDQLDAHRVEDWLAGVQLMCFGAAHHTSDQSGDIKS